MPNAFRKRRLGRLKKLREALQKEPSGGATKEGQELLDIRKEALSRINRNLTISSLTEDLEVLGYPIDEAVKGVINDTISLHISTHHQVVKARRYSDERETNG